jgi:RNA recognition motif-containing protein
MATTEKDLRGWFAEHGPVEQVAVSVDPGNGRSRGFGFVTMATPADARSAIRALNGKRIGTSTLSVSQAWLGEPRLEP